MYVKKHLERIYPDAFLAERDGGTGYNVNMADWFTNVLAALLYSLYNYPS